MMMKTNLETRGQRGAAMIEFALVLPVLLIVLLGTVEFSFLLYNKAMITNASREGARLGIVYRPVGGLTHPICGDIGTRAQQYAQNNLITFADPNPGPIINSCIYAKTADPTVPCPADCSGFAGIELPGDFLRVEVHYTYDFLVIDILLAWVFGDLDLEAVSIMRFE
jgi:hypothetical protein